MHWQQEPHVSWFSNFFIIFKNMNLFWWAYYKHFKKSQPMVSVWYGSGGKSCRLAVGGLPVRSHPGRVKVSLSKTPNPQLLLTSWLVPCMAANRRWCVNVCVNGWMRGINCTALWIKALYKCSPFTILPFTMTLTALTEVIGLSFCECLFIRSK